MTKTIDNMMNEPKGKRKADLVMLLALPALVLFTTCLTIAEIALFILTLLDARFFLGSPKHQRFLIEAMQERDMFTWM